MRADIAPGRVFPDYELPDHTDTPRKRSEIRPDWDLSKPGLRARWDAGDYAPFHGWSKRAGEKPARV